jgi:PAS domain S-box-containing protein
LYSTPFFKIKTCFKLIALVLIIKTLTFVTIVQAARETKAVDLDISNPHVLVLHSYHHGFTWTDNITKGIRSILNQETPSIELHFEFLDARRIASENYFRELQDVFRMFYRQYKALIWSVAFVFGVLIVLIVSLIHSINLRKRAETSLHKANEELEQRVKERTEELSNINEKLKREIGEHKHTAQALEDAHFIISKSPAVAFLWENREGWPVKFVTENVEGILGYSADEFMSGKVVYSEIIYPEDLNRVSGEVSRHSGERHRNEFTHVPYRIVTRDGNVKWVRDSTFIGRDIDGNVTHYQGIVEDITKQKEAEDFLAAEKERLAVTLRSIGDGVIATDTEGKITLINKVAERLTEWTEQEAFGRSINKVFHIVGEFTRERCVNPVQKVIQSGHVVGLANHTMLISKHGKEYVIADSGAPIFNDVGQIVGVVLVFRDITKERQMQQELLKVEKLESLGVLAGGVAHDFNNFLTAIIGNLSLAKLDARQVGMGLGRLEKIDKAALRAKGLTQQLLTFSKGGEPVAKTVSLERLVKDAVIFALRGSKVRCEFSFEEGLWAVEADEAQIGQVVNHLFLNADQAMSEGGVIHIRLNNVNLELVNQYSLPPGRYVKLSFQDEGIGIPEDHLSKIFDPYFTTKQGGNGLGLTIAYSIVNKHEGRITVESEFGKGTTFDILLPASEKPISLPKVTVGMLHRGHGKILVMDDEEIIRDVASQLLKEMGYDVALAKNGEEAIAMYKAAQEAGESFDLVIMDLTVSGGMGGKEAIQKLLKQDPDAKAIVSSGYSNDPVMSNYDGYGFVGVVKKPYGMEELSETLELVLKGNE